MSRQLVRKEEPLDRKRSGDPSSSSHAGRVVPLQAPHHPRGGWPADPSGGWGLSRHQPSAHRAAGWLGPFWRRRGGARLGRPGRPSSAAPRRPSPPGRPPPAPPCGPTAAGTWSGAVPGVRHPAQLGKGQGGPEGERMYNNII